MKVLDGHLRILTIAMTAAGLWAVPFASQGQETRLAAVSTVAYAPDPVPLARDGYDRPRHDQARAGYDQAEVSQNTPDEDDFDFDFDDGFSGDLDRDRYESFNRVMFAFNRGVDRFVLNPFTHSYRFAVPKLVRNAVYNAFLNLDSPVVLVNSILQGRSEDAGDTIGRLILNSTVGLGGLIDVAAMQGTPRPQTDFGETLAHYGAGRGAYLVVPFIGPTTVRNGVGRGVDVLFQPLTYLVGPLPGAFVSAGRDITRREQEFDGLQALEKSSIDYYAALRSAYLQEQASRMRNDPPTESTRPRAAKPSGARCAGGGLLHSRRPAHVRDRPSCTARGLRLQREDAGV